MLGFCIECVEIGKSLLNTKPCDYQERGVCGCHCTIGLDEGRFQFGHLLQGGRTDAVVFANCIFPYKNRNIFTLRNYKHYISSPEKHALKIKRTNVYLCYNLNQNCV